MCDVQGCRFGACGRRSAYKAPEFGHLHSAGSTGWILLRSVWTGIQIPKRPGRRGYRVVSAQHLKMTDQDPNITLDIEHKSVRGRACPACGGKIIPSNTAVFQTQGNPEATYVSWQCERCGRLEVFERSQPAVAKHAKPASALSAKNTESAGNGSVGRFTE